MDRVVKKWLQQLNFRLHRWDRGRLLFRESVSRDMKTLYGKQSDRYLAEHDQKKVKLACLGIGVGLLLMILSFLGDLSGGELAADGTISRNGYEEASKDLQLQAQVDGETYDLQIEVEARRYTEQQLEEMTVDAADALERQILEENPSTDEVSTPLKLEDAMEGYPFTVEWSCSDYAVLHADGSIAAEQIPEEGLPVMLTAVLRYYDYEKIISFPVRVVQPELTAQEKLLRTLQQSVAVAEEEKRNEETMRLPKEADGKEIRWKEPVSFGATGFGLFGVLIGALLFWGMDRDVRSAVEKRGEELKRDYPGIVRKLSIYMASGWTLRLAWEQVVREYERHCASGREKAAYDEMTVTMREMESGMTEGEAYLRFGHRTGLQQYRKLATLMEQNLKKGSGSLVRLLSEEARLAMQERRHQARSRGEKMSSKLLVPMMIQLGIVMLMILLPAFLAM